jgi:hypothetical protein
MIVGHSNPPIDHFPKYCVNALLKAPLPLNLAPPEGGLWLTFAILQTDLPLGFTTCIPRSSTQPSCGSVFMLGFSKSTGWIARAACGFLSLNDFWTVIRPTDH